MKCLVIVDGYYLLAYIFHQKHLIVIFRLTRHSQDKDALGLEIKHKNAERLRLALQITGNPLFYYGFLKDIQSYDLFQILIHIGSQPDQRLIINC